MYFDFRLWAMTRGLRGRILLAAVIGLVGLPVGIGRLALSGVVIAGVIQGRAFADLAPLLLVIGLLVASRSLVQLLKEEVANRTAAEMKVRLRERIYRHVLALGPGPFDQRRTGDVLLYLVEGVEQLETFFGLYLPQLIVASLTPLILFIFMAALDLPTALIMLFFALFSLVVPSFFHRWNASSSVKRRDAYSALGADFLDGIQGLATLKAFGQSRARGALLAERARALYRGTMAVLAANCATGGLTLLGISAGASLALGLGAVRVSQGTLELQTLAIVMMLGVEVYRPLRELAALYHRGMSAMSATSGIYTILDSVPDVIDGTTLARCDNVTDTASRAVSFENVTFAYPGRGNALEDVSFTLQAGETLGLVGPSGAGKSTVVWLLLRFFDPQQGRVLLGGRDLRDLPLDEVRHQFALVAQDTYLFYGTVAENLRFGKPDASQEQLEAAARLANAHDFIAALPRGYETLVGERGANLSGGQRQRIAIARALLKDAPILLLDEALSSVDSENEAAIQEALDRLQRDRTTLVIAHRLSSVVNADRILVLNQGRLVESGSHVELASSGGAYGRLMAGQGGDGAIGGDRSTRRQGDRATGLAGDWAAGRPGDSPTGRLGEEAVDNLPAPHPPIPPSPHSPVALWSRLLALVRPWWGELSLTFFLGLARAFSVVGLAVVSALIVGAAARGEPFGGLLITLGALVPISAILTWTESWISHDLAYRLLAEMRIAIYDLLDPLAPAYFQRRRSGDLASTATGDVELIEYFFAHTIGPAFVAVLVPGAVLVGLGIIAWPLALALLPFLVIVGLSPFVAQRAAEGAAERTRRQLGEVNAQMVDSLQGLRTIVAFQRGEARLAEIARQGRSFNVHQLAFLRNQALHNVSIEASTGYGGLAVLAVGAWLATAGAMPPTLLALASVTALATFSPITELAKTVKQLAETLAAAERIFAIQDEPVPVLDGPGVSPPPRAESLASAAPAIRFESVSFAYGPGLPQALRRLTFEIEPGQTVALVGRSGAGKTTVAHLILRFWDPQEGRVTLSGHDLRDFKLDDLRQHLALVAQDTYLFNWSLRENLALGRTGASELEIERASRQASLHDFVASLPEQYSTRIGERGIQLSGGQRQRVAIARAILKDAPMLVLDEATSHLDAENERLVHAALDELARGRTTLVIAHRLSTVRRADRIIVLDDGAAVEQGTHDELLARGGLYAQLVATQLTGQLDSSDRRGKGSGGLHESLAE